MSHVCVHAVFQQRRRETLSLGSWWFIIAICNHIWIPVISEFSPEFDHCFQEFVSFCLLPARLERFIWQITEKNFYIYEQKKRKSKIQPSKDMWRAVLKGKTNTKIRAKSINQMKLNAAKLARSRGFKIFLNPVDWQSLRLADVCIAQCSTTTSYL